jgi:hypothetical protein
MLADNAVMTEIPPNTNFQLSQALNQLTQAAPDSAVARQAIEVIVKQLEGNLISLNPTNTAQLKAALLPNTNLQGSLDSGQRYQVKLNTQQQSVLQFFSAGANGNLSTIPLSEPLTQLILRLPAQQLNQLISTVLPQLKLMSAGVNTNTLAVLPATIVEQGNKQLALNFDSLKPPFTLNLSVNQTLPVTQGDKVAVEISAKGNVWQLNIIKLTQAEVASLKHLDQVILSNRDLSGLAKTSPLNTPNSLLSGTVDKAIISSQTTQPSAQETKQAVQSLKINLTPETAAPLIKSLLSEQASRQAIELPVQLKTLVSQLVQSNNTGSQELLNKVLSTVPDKISLQVKASGEAALLIQHPKLVANLPLTVAEMDSLKPLKIAGLETLKTELILTKANGETNKAVQSTTTTLKVAQDINSGKTGVDINPLTGANIDNSRIAEQGKLLTTTPLLDVKTLQQLIESNPGIKSVITPQLLNNKSEQSELLQNLLRVSQPKAELASTVLSNIDKILNDPANFKGFSESTTQNWLKQLSQEITQVLPQGKEQDASQIKQLMTAPPLSTSSVQLVTPPASQGLLSGLITLLQVSLAARLMRNQPSQAERIAQILPSLFSDTSKTGSTPNPAKAMQEFSQLEQRQQLMREIGKLLSDHQTNKLKNAEKLLQGQETFYYNLPSVFGGVFKNIELLIKREEQKDQQSEQSANQTQNWQLTMKLGVGELGELLTKAKLRPDQLEMDFYASNAAVLKQLMNFLPLLKRRLDALGIEMTKSQCQLGKIPDTLDERSYHIFKAKA